MHCACALSGCCTFCCPGAPLSEDLWFVETCELRMGGQHGFAKPLGELCSQEGVFGT